MHEPTLPAWTYQAPRRPDGFHDQCYYRGGRWNHIAHADGDALDDRPQIALFRFSQDESARLTIELEVASIKADLRVDELVSLRDALNDALADIAVAQAERERAESFWRISDEMREAEDRGAPGPGAYYRHPDIHYVPPGEVQAKVRELEAAGAKRYMVLPMEVAA